MKNNLPKATGRYTNSKEAGLKKKPNKVKFGVVTSSKIPTRGLTKHANSTTRKIIKKSR